MSGSKVSPRKFITTVSFLCHRINQPYCGRNYSDWLPIRVIMQIFAHQMSRPASTTPFPLLNEASVIEIADIWLSASIPSDHSCDYIKLLFLRKNGRRQRSARRAEKGVTPREWTEIFSNYTLHTLSRTQILSDSAITGLSRSMAVHLSRLSTTYVTALLEWHWCWEWDKTKGCLHFNCATSWGAFRDRDWNSDTLLCTAGWLELKWLKCLPHSVRDCKEKTERAFNLCSQWLVCTRRLWICVCVSVGLFLLACALCAIC